MRPAPKSSSAKLIPFPPLLLHEGKHDFGHQNGRGFGDFQFEALTDGAVRLDSLPQDTRPTRIAERTGREVDRQPQIGIGGKAVQPDGKRGAINLAPQFIAINGRHEIARRNCTAVRVQHADQTFVKTRSAPCQPQRPLADSKPKPAMLQCLPHQMKCLPVRLGNGEGKGFAVRRFNVQHLDRGRLHYGLPRWG